MTQDIWSDRFHWCALAAGFIAVLEGRLQDSCYVRDLAYQMYEEGAFGDRVRHLRADCHDSAPRPRVLSAAED